jgi:hypothetical protein
MMPLWSTGATLIGLVFLTLASMYSVTPAGALPPFVPGYALAVSDIRFDLAVGTGVLSLFAFAIAWTLRLRHVG